MEPFFRVDENGRVRHAYVWRMPKSFFLVSTCGFPEYENFFPIIKTYKAQPGKSWQRKVALRQTCLRSLTAALRS